MQPSVASCCSELIEKDDEVGSEADEELYGKAGARKLNHNKSL
jgi:hypothetical protein